MRGRISVVLLTCFGLAPQFVSQGLTPQTQPSPVKPTAVEQTDSGIPVRAVKEKFRVEPLYTEEARQAGIEGTVVVLTEVTPAGFPENPRVLRGLGHGLDQQALEAVQNWQFEPYKEEENETPIRVVTLIPLHFRLTQNGSGKESKFLFKIGVDEGLTIPKVLSREAAHYTEEARAAKVSGRVVLYTEITPDGQAENVHILQGLGKGMDEEAIRAIQKWKFRPATKEGKAVALIMTVEMNFSLR